MLTFFLEGNGWILALANTEQALDVPQNLLRFNETMTREQIRRHECIPSTYTHEARFNRKAGLDVQAKEQAVGVCGSSS
jgi:hypothetical protein